MWSIFSLLVLSTHLALGWVSGGDKTDSAYLALNRLTVSRETDARPLRIQFDLDPAATQASDSVSLSDYPDITNMIESVQTYFLNTLCLKRVIGNIEITEATCIGNGVTVNPRVYSGADVVIIVRGTNSASNNNGFSQVAFLEAGSKNQPLVGVISINKALFDSEPDFMRKWMFLAHLTIHVLGFSEKLYPQWVVNFNSDVKLGEGSIWKEITIRGIKKKAIITTNALNAAKAAFNHPGMLGVELEEDLISGYRSEHWDARLLFNDVSCVRSHSEMIISTVTIGLLVDSGWYLDCKNCKGTPPIFGKEYGCSFVEQPCINSAKSNNHANLWCTSSETGICDAFNLNKASCSPINPVNHPYQLIPLKAEEYFGNPFTGGSDRFTDFCPYPMPLNNGNCRRANSSPGFGETYGMNSRCFEHTLELGVSGKYLSSVASCFDVKCNSDGTTEVNIGGQKVTCPAAGGVITVPLAISNSGWLRCPSSSVICGNLPCLNACNGKGCCNNGVCNCFDGWRGVDCNEKCPEKCLVCPLGDCVECAAGYYLDPVTKNCIKCKFCCLTCNNADSCLTSRPDCNGISPICASNCHDCLTPGTCGSPDPGFCIDKITSVIKTCCDGCQTCAADDCCNCLECLPGYMKTSINTCTKSCVVNCLTCQSTTSCFDCKVGFNLTPDGRCLRCPDGCVDCVNKCDPDCTLPDHDCSIQSECDDYCYGCAKVECTACKSGFRMTSDKKCQRICPLNCAACDKNNNLICLKCSSGFFLNNINSPPTCDPCETSCLTCTYVSETTTNCLTCRSGFFLRQQIIGGVSENDCVDCETGCYSCVDENSCNGCVARFYLKNLHCHRCEYGCKICTDEFACSQADPGFFVKNDGHVARCHKSCATCDADLICNTCMAGFFFYECSSENCLCRDCEDNCAYCSSPTECIVCRSGYFLNEVNRCIVCDYFCSSCEMAGKCLSCRWGYYLKSDKTCGKCDVGCQYCVDFEHCKLCLGGYYPDEYFCNPCPNKCAFCWSPSQCYSCLIGWWLNKDTSVPTCEACPTTCVRCNSPTDCVLCKRTYFISSGICTKCGQNCAFCTSELICTICESGFFLDIDSTCKPCQGGCLDCCDASTCMKAKNGWWLQYFPSIYTDPTRDAAIGSGVNSNMLGKYVASPCGYKCISCMSLADCGSCSRGAYLVDDKECKDCEFPCSQCRSKTECILCTSKYYLKDTSCFPCSENCNACTETECTAPKAGFYVDPNNKFKVLPCVAPCAACVGIGENDCITCAGSNGRVLETEVRVSATVFSYKCAPCDTGCRTCNPRSLCITALSSYYIAPLAPTAPTTPPPVGPPAAPTGTSSGTSPSAPSGSGTTAPTANSVLKCPATCTNCVLKDSVVTCTSCITRYGIQGNECLACQDPNCLSCSPTNVCTVCAATFYVNSSGGCSKCVSPCYTCKSDVLCMTCINTFYLPDPKVPSVCSNCITNCVRCTAGNNCIQCASKMYFDSTLIACQPCPANCTACKETVSKDANDNIIKTVECTACASRCALDGLLCKPCTSPFCTSCKPIGVCAVCQGGYYLDDSTKDCFKCIAPCGNCLSSTYCLSCAGAFFLDANTPGSCKACLTNCYRCTSTMDCSSIRGGYYLSAGGSSLAAIIICPEACTACKEIIIDNLVYVNCTTCRSPYIQTATSVPGIFKCCMNGCSTCENKITCDSCLTGWSPNSAKVCFKCSNFCDTCLSSIRCSKCSTGYLPVTASGQVYCAPEKCKDSNSTQYCWTCKPGFFWKDGGICDDCPEGCTSCNLDVCQGCKYGYYIAGRQCWKCKDVCKSCDNAERCADCIDGLIFIPETGACVAPGTPPPSSGCPDGNYKDAQGCQACPTGCSKCSSYWKCLESLSGFWLYENGWDTYACPQNCLICNPSTTVPHNLCWNCKKDYFREGTSCIDCPVECSECNNDVCAACKPGFDFEGTKCKAIPS